MKNYFALVFLALFFSALIFVSTFFLGKYSINVEEKTIVEYRELPTVSVSVTPKSFSFSVPKLPAWLYFTDTVTQKIDTAAILNDWIMKREYADRLIADSTGTIDYRATVQYNQLQNMTLDYTPIQRIVTTEKVIRERFIPFVLLGGNTAGFGQLEGGILFKKWGISAEVGSNFSGQNYLGGKVGIRF